MGGSESIKKTAEGLVAFDRASGWESKPCDTREEARLEKRKWRAKGGASAMPMAKPTPILNPTTPKKKKAVKTVKNTQTIMLGKKELVISSNPDDTVIGRVFFFSVSSFEIKAKALMKLCKDTGIDFDKIFYDIEPINVYKNLTNLDSCPYKNKLEHFEKKEDGFYRYFVSTTSPEGKKRTGTLRWLVQEYKKEASDKPKFKTIGKWDFENNQIISKCEAKKGSMECAIFSEMTKKLDALMVEYADVYIDKHFRDGLRRIITSCKAIPLRSSGGIYYTTEQYRSVVESMGDLMKRVSVKTKTEGSTLYTMEVVNGSEERDMVYYQFEAHVKAQADKLLKKVTEKLKEGKSVRNDFFNNTLDEAKQLAKLRDEYRENLMVEFDSADITIDVLEGKLNRLADLLGGA